MRTFGVHAQLPNCNPASVTPQWPCHRMNVRHATNCQAARIDGVKVGLAAATLLRAAADTCWCHLDALYIAFERQTRPDFSKRGCATTIATSSDRPSRHLPRLVWVAFFECWSHQIPLRSHGCTLQSSAHTKRRGHLELQLLSPLVPLPQSMWQRGGGVRRIVGVSYHRFGSVVKGTKIRREEDWKG